MYIYEIVKKINNFNVTKCSKEPHLGFLPERVSPDHWLSVCSDLGGYFYNKEESPEVHEDLIKYVSKNSTALPLTVMKRIMSSTLRT